MISLRCYWLLGLAVSWLGALLATAPFSTANNVEPDKPIDKYSTGAKRLYKKLLGDGNYKKLIRPVGNTSDALVVKISLRLTSIIDVDEKNQIMTTNVWLEQHWFDQRLSWDPAQYDDVQKLYVPSIDIWIPDIVLYNSADGNFTIKTMTRATVFSNGLVTWIPPAIYKSLCLIDVEYFPFDDQLCTLKIGSWSYDGYSVDIKHMDLDWDDKDDTKVIKRGINLVDYSLSTEWDLLEVPAKKDYKYYTCCSEPYPDITFNITIRRKTLYHSVNLILPCVAICCVTLLVFLIPVYTGEKITMGITILNSLNIFLLLVAEINPPTSLAVPLIGKYLLFTMVLVTGTIIVSVFVLNIHFRSPSTHVMSPWIRYLFLYVLPRLLFMQRPGDKAYMKMKRDNTAAIARGEKPPHHINGIRDIYSKSDDSSNACLVDDVTARENYFTASSSRGSSAATLSSSSGADFGRLTDSPGQRRQSSLPPPLLQAVIGVNFIVQHLKDQDEVDQVKQDWQFIAMVTDRLFMWMFTAVSLVGTFGIIVQAPTLYDAREPISHKP